MKWIVAGTLAVIWSAALAEDIDPKFIHHKHPQNAGAQDGPTVFEINANKYHDMKDDVQNLDSEYVPPHAARAPPGGNAFLQFRTNYMAALNDYAHGKRETSGSVGQNFYRALRAHTDVMQLGDSLEEQGIEGDDEHAPGQDQSDFLNDMQTEHGKTYAGGEFYTQVKSSGVYRRNSHDNEEEELLFNEDDDSTFDQDQHDFLNYKRSEHVASGTFGGRNFFRQVRDIYRTNSDIQERSYNAPTFVGRNFYRAVQSQYQVDSDDGEEGQDDHYQRNDQNNGHRQNDQGHFLDSSDSFAGRNFFRKVYGQHQDDRLNARSDESTDDSPINEFAIEGQDQKDFLSTKSAEDSFVGRTFYKAFVGKYQSHFPHGKRSENSFAGRAFYRQIRGEDDDWFLMAKRGNDQEGFLDGSDSLDDNEAGIGQDQSDFLNHKGNAKEDYIKDSGMEQDRSCPYGQASLNFLRKVKEAYHDEDEFQKRATYHEQVAPAAGVPQEEDPQAIEFFGHLVKGHKRSLSKAAKDYCEMKLEQGVAAKDLPGFCDDNIVIEALKEQEKEHATPANLRDELYQREEHAKQVLEASQPQAWKDSVRTAWSKIKRYYDLDELNLMYDSPLESRGEKFHREPEYAQHQSEIPQDPDRRRRRGLTIGEIEDGDSLPDGVIRSTMKKRLMNEETKDFLRRRSYSSTVNATLDNLIDYYILDAQIGTPPQPVELMVDTGSSDMWVYAKGHSNNPDIVTFDPGKSQTWQGSNKAFRIRYVTGGASGSWGKDSVNIQGATLKHQQIAVVTKGAALEGVPGMIGIGMPALESVSWQRYENVPMSMYTQGYIKTPTYSLYLNSVDADQGQLLFGGIDHAKYKPPLYVIPRKSNRNFSSQCSISTNSFIGSITGTFDSGTTLGLLPNRILKSIQQYWQMKYDSEGKYYYVDSLASISKKPLTFDFSGAVYKLYPRQLFIRGEQIGPEFKKNHQVFGFISSEDNSRLVIFGDVFLRGFYIVYDLQHPQIGIAQASYDIRNEDIQAITSPNFPKAKIAPHS